MHKILLTSAFFIGVFAVFGKSHADTPKLSFPVNCTLGQDCWTVSYVDMNPSGDYHEDYRCHSKTYEGHKGTDFAVSSRIDMQDGVNVLAAAPGEVLRMRDGEDDTRKTEEEYQAIRAANKDCGNGVIINHKGGLQTFYCHLKQDSIRVQPGDTVQRGQKIAQIGQSGFSEFPHLHFSVIKDSTHIDPFTGLSMNEGCKTAPKGSLWDKTIAYEPFAVFNGGFDTQKPNFEAIREGRTPYKTLSHDANALIYWIGLYHAKKGDTLDMRIYDPKGHVFASKKMTVERHRKRDNYYYAGRKNNGQKLIPGTYRGEAIYRREGFIPQTFRHFIDIK